LALACKASPDASDKELKYNGFCQDAFDQAAFDIEKIDGNRTRIRVKPAGDGSKTGTL
jgi:hypothetical protein